MFSSKPTLRLVVIPAVSRRHERGDRDHDRRRRAQLARGDAVCGDALRGDAWNARHLLGNAERRGTGQTGEAQLVSVVQRIQGNVHGTTAEHER